jgi:pheromone shutdown protein TraB
LFVELCSHRVGLLLDPVENHEDYDNPPDADSSLSNGMTATSQKMSLLFTKIQADYAKKLNVTIGGEFRSAFQSALTQQKRFWQQEYMYRHNIPIGNDEHCHPCAIIFGDRPVRITLSRAWESLRFFGKCKLVSCLLWSSIRQPSEKELKEWMESILNDRTGKNDLMTKAMEEMGKAFPSIKRVIIEERDDFMTAKLRQCAEMLMQMEDDTRQHRVIVAIVGAGHCNGMMNRLLNGNKITKPEEILPALVETKKRKLNNDEEVSSLVTDVVQFDYEYAMQNEAVQ